MANTALDGKPYAGNPHVRIDEGDGASAKPRRSSLLYKTLLAMAMAGVTAIALGDSIAVTPVQDEHGLDTAFDLALEVTGEKYLYAAWGAEDAGTDRAVWANQRLLGVANSSSNTWHFVAPEGWSYSLKSLRFFLVESGCAYEVACYANGISLSRLG